jgi:hypothetical protein
MFEYAGAKAEAPQSHGCGAGLQPCRQSSPEGLPHTVRDEAGISVPGVEPQLQFRVREGVAAIRAAAGASGMSGGCGVRSGTTL